ncbi:double-strand-break repair protein rad21 homolog A-like [Bolinopsis microptera]|uniref:double-strand-break repair protein rad21 homolog A-like n=1 Tax=Bolinopsis microptera TaxID=2820187 RepID=UPI00307A2FAB
MFYANVFLAKKSALTRVWLAAHWDKKLTKAHVYETNIAESIGEIISPKQKLALRTTGHLLLGVVRIYSRKAKYLLTDCSEAFVKIKMAFRPGIVDMPEENREAPMHAVTLPEVFHDFDSTLMDFGGLDMTAQFGHNQGRLEDITMREDLSQNRVFTLGDFEEPGNLGNMEFSMGLEDPELARKEAQLDQMREESVVTDRAEKSTLQDSTVGDETTIRDTPIRAGGDMLNMPEMSDLGGEFLDPSLNFNSGDYSQLETAEEPKQYSSGLTPHHSMMTPRHMGMTPASPHQSRYPGSMTPQHMGMTPKGETPTGHYITRHLGGKEVHEPMAVADDEFLLEPIMDTSDYTRTRKKRKLVIDQEKQLSSDFIRRELDSTNDIVQAPSFAPPSRKSMHWKATAGVDKLFSTPGRPGLGMQLNKLLTHNLTLNFPNEEDEEDDIVSVHDDDPEEVTEVKQSKSPVKESSPTKAKAPESPTRSHHASSSDDDAGGDDLFDFNFGNDDSSSDDEQPPKKQKTSDDLSDVEEKEGETFEDFDNRRWNKRTHAVLNMLRRDLDAKGQVNFFSFAEDNNRKQAASKFYSILLLKKGETINVTQSEPFSDIIVHAGPKYHEI